MLAGAPSYQASVWQEEERSPLGGKGGPKEDHLFAWGSLSRGGRKTGWGTTEGEPFCRPHSLGGGASHEVRPVFDFGGLNRFKIPRFGNAGHIPQGGGCYVSVTWVHVAVTVHRSG